MSKIKAKNFVAFSKSTAITIIEPTTDQPYFTLALIDGENILPLQTCNHGDCHKELEEKIEQIKTFVQNSKETWKIGGFEKFINERGDTLGQTIIEI